MACPPRPYVTTSRRGCAVGGPCVVTAAAVVVVAPGHYAEALMAHGLLFLDPGHFHAALTLRERHPLVADDITVYTSHPADDRHGGEVAEFVRLVEAFNR